MDAPSFFRVLGEREPALSEAEGVGTLTSCVLASPSLPIVNLHKLSYYEPMSMTSLNISLPEALKQYVEGQVASGDWGTPSEYVRELIRQDKERRLGNLEQELIAAARGRKIELPIAEIRRKGLISALRDRTRRR
jgi:antitoxin ParD1/3/4